MNFPSRKKVFGVLAGIFFAGFFLALLFAGQKGEPAQKSFTVKDREEICAVIRGGVEDNEWWGAASKEEVRQILARYYTAPLLDEISTNAWNFIRRPTDWYWEAGVKSIELRRQTKDLVLAAAELEIIDVTTGRTEQGNAQYTLKKTAAGWRICRARYQWPSSTQGAEE